MDVCKKDTPGRCTACSEDRHRKGGRASHTGREAVAQTWDFIPGQWGATEASMPGSSTFGVSFLKDRVGYRRQETGGGKNRLEPTQLRLTGDVQKTRVSKLTDRGNPVPLVFAGCPHNCDSNPAPNVISQFVLLH